MNPASLSIPMEKLARLNWWVLVFLALLGGVGVAMLYSASGGEWTPWARTHGVASDFGHWARHCRWLDPDTVLVESGMVDLWRIAACADSGRIARNDRHGCAEMAGFRLFALSAFGSHEDCHGLGAGALFPQE